LVRRGELDTDPQADKQNAIDVLMFKKKNRKGTGRGEPNRGGRIPDRKDKGNKQTRKIGKPLFRRRENRGGRGLGKKRREKKLSNKPKEKGGPTPHLIFGGEKKEGPAQGGKAGHPDQDICRQRNSRPGRRSSL